MTGKERHMFPGNNTTQGFYSYYQYILGQDEADKIYCIKGGPGTGKSSFMKKIANEMLEDGHDIDFMHCSSDPDSVDGIVIKDKHVAFIDGTAPHIIDPKTPGAVDTIIHLGEYWNEEGIKEKKREIIENHERLSALFAKAYNYFGAAKKMYDNVAVIYEKALIPEAFYRIATNLTSKELAHKEINQNKGKVKKFFASGVTPQGLKHYLGTLVEGYKTVYILGAPVGVGSERILNIFAESAIYRGFDVELFYCPMAPETKVEHLLIPELSIAMVTSNDYHQFKSPDAFNIDLGEYVDQKILEEQRSHLDDGLEMMDCLMKKGIDCLTKAKAEHDTLEEFYIPHMDFEKIEALRKEIVHSLR